MKRWILDLFCGAGGAAKGYANAGFGVLGVDIEPQPNYAGDHFIQRDALEFIHMQGHELSLASLEGDLEPVPFDAIHASPPCQAYSAVTGESRDKHPDLVGPTRELLERTGLPYVIENVVGAPLNDPITLCGSSFGLPLIRHRLFETNFPVMAPPCAHGQLKHRFDIYEHGKWRKSQTPAIYGTGGGKAAEHWAEALGIDWMTREEMALAIPPAYTEHVGGYLMQSLQKCEHEPNRFGTHCFKCGALLDVDRDRTGEALYW